MLTKLRTLLHGAEHHRAYFYRLAGTIGILAVGSGLLTNGQEAKVLLLVGAVLGVGGNGLATANTSAKRNQRGNTAVLTCIAVCVIATVILLGFFGIHGHH